MSEKFTMLPTCKGPKDHMVYPCACRCFLDCSGKYRERMTDARCRNLATNPWEFQACMRTTRVENTKSSSYSPQ